ncbi:MAG TPA: carbamoyltransferase HypF, partial [Rhodoblastus sp.]|nr:carbamoyltransferase HypF [Rhodoblastus sp.]
GEALRLDGRGGFARLGHISPLALPGGDRAAREPLRMGVAAFAALGRLHEAAGFFADRPEALQVARIMSVRAPQTTTSVGRLFDAASALLGFARRQEFEGEAAMRLEALARAPRTLPGGFGLRDGVVEFAPLLRHLIDVRPDAREGAELLHGTLIEGLGAWLAATARPGEKIALGGGCLMNKVLAEGLAGLLRQKGFAPLLARKIPPNDGGLSLGQAALARAALMNGGMTNVSGHSSAGDGTA